MERNDERGKRFTALLNRPIMVLSQPISVPPPPPLHPKIFLGRRIFLKREREKGAPRRRGNEWKIRKGVFHIYIRDRGGFLPSSLCKKKSVVSLFFFFFAWLFLRRKKILNIYLFGKKKKLSKVKSPHLGCNIVQPVFLFICLTPQWKITYN